MEEPIKRIILAVDDDADILSLLRMILESHGYKFIGVNRGYKALKVAEEERPDLIILDVMMPGMSGIEVCKKLRENITTRRIPVIILSAKNSTDDVIEGIEGGAVEYLEKPFIADILLARIKSIMNLQDILIDSNPLSRLPGNQAIKIESMKRIKSGEKFAFCYADLDNFKHFNDKYGFFSGDKIIEMTANTIQKSIKKYGASSDFFGHVGGDDFMFITSPERAIPITESIIEEFDKQVLDFLNPEDIDNGYIESKNRQGLLEKKPITSISIEIITNEQKDIKHPGQISKILGELKEYVKKMPGSNYVTDKRYDEESSDIYYKRPKVLIADKNLKKAWHITKVLKQDGSFQTVTLDSGAAAMEALPNNKPDLILLAKELDLIDGYTTFHLIRKNEKYTQLPFIFITDPEETLPPEIENEDRVFHIYNNMEDEVFLQRIKGITKELHMEAIKNKID